MPTEVSDSVVFFVNGKKITVQSVQPEMTLLYYLRSKLRLTGTKLGCSEGGCGACTVMVSKYDHLTKKIEHIPVNACLAPLCSMDGLAVTTVEGIGSTKTRLHPVQERLAKAHGSQCGFCTPGIVMSMYTLLRNHPIPTQKQVDSAFEGNLCRCTGYRPIIEGYKTFTKEYCCKGKNANGGCCQQENGAIPVENGTKNECADVSHELFEPSEFMPFDPTQEPIFPPELMLPEAAESRTLYIKGDRVTWIRPSTLHELLDLKSQFPHAKLVVGNTEVGIEMKFKGQDYKVLIAPTHIPEMNAIERTDHGVTFGASVTLTTIEETLEQLIECMAEEKTRIFVAIVEMLRWFAGRQVRSVAAVGGNIMTASPISDLNPLFMAAGCDLTVGSKGGVKRQIKFDEKFFRGYRKTALEPSEVLLSIHIPFTSKSEYFYGYKQAHRRDDDIAIVNAGMRVVVEKDDRGSGWIVKDCALSYGGMAPTTVMALKTMKAIVGRTWNDELVSEACRQLEEDLPLAPNAPGGQVEYRRTLTTSFFFKFYLTVLSRLHADQPSSVADISESYRSATKLFHREPTKSVQTYQEVPRGQKIEDVVGRPVIHSSALKQVTGEAVYCDDMPPFSNELYLGLVLSKQAHAKLVSMDASEALTLPGVHGFVSAKDVPGNLIVGTTAVHDEEVFALNEVTCVGQLIGAVVADTQMQAQIAAKAVKVTYETLPKIITIEEAIASKSFYGDAKTVKNGDLQAGFSASDHIIEGEMRVGGQEHFYLETQVTIAVPKLEDGEMELFVSTQNPSDTQKVVALALGVPNNRILVRTKRMGGGFGGKETRNIWLSAAAAVAANKFSRPVRIMLDRDEDMITTGTRHPFLAKYKVGFTKDGKIQALDIDLYANAGNSVDLSFAVIERAVFHVDNAYRIPNLHVRGHVCKTNISSNTAFRGFGGPQGMMMCESLITDVAVTCGISQRKVREINLYREGESTHFNQQLVKCHLERCWTELIDRTQYERRRAQCQHFNELNRWKKRGIALTPTKFGIAFTATFLNQAGALVHVYRDGSVLLAHGGTEMGQGLHTKMIQIASRILGIPQSRIYISETSTNTVINTSATAASASSDLNGMAVKNACEQLKVRLVPYEKANPKGKWEDWVCSAYMDRVNLSANGFYKTPDLGYDWNTNKGRPFNYFCYGASCSEVEIDCLTGDHHVLRTDIVMDVGNSLNPAIDIGQVEGGFVQGLGLFTIEERRFLQNGSLFTTGPGTYKIPGFADIPVEFNVHLLRSAPNEKAVFSSKAVGEPPLFLAASVFYAIKDAVMSARHDANVEGIFRFDSPATSERIRLACVDQFTRQFPARDPSIKGWNLYA